MKCHGKTKKNMMFIFLKNKNALAMLNFIKLQVFNN